MVVTFSPIFLLLSSNFSSINIRFTLSENSKLLMNLQILQHKFQTLFFNHIDNFTSVAKVSSQRENIVYICGLRARIECEPFSEHSTRSDRVIDIDYVLSLGASTLPAANQKLFRYKL